MQRHKALYSFLSGVNESLKKENIENLLVFNINWNVFVLKFRDFARNEKYILKYVLFTKAINVLLLELNQN